MNQLIKSMYWVLFVSCFMYVSTSYADIVVKANGVEIGTNLGTSINYENGGLNSVVLTDKGYILLVRIRDIGQNAQMLLSLDSLYFTTSNCTGLTYIAQFGQVMLPGMVLPFGSSTGPLYYIGKTAERVPLPIQSRMDSKGVCTAVSTPQRFVRVRPNDPAVTGVSSAIFPRPITFEERLLPSN